MKLKVRLESWSASDWRDAAQAIAGSAAAREKEFYHSEMARLGVAIAENKELLEEKEVAAGNVLFGKREAAASRGFLRIHSTA